MNDPQDATQGRKEVHALANLKLRGKELRDRASVGVINFCMEPVRVRSVVRQVKTCIVYVDPTELVEILPRFGDCDSAWLPVLEMIEAYLKFCRVNTLFRHGVIMLDDSAVCELKSKSHGGIVALASRVHQPADETSIPNVQECPHFSIKPS